MIVDGEAGMSFTGILPVRSMGYTAKLISLTREDAKGMTGDGSRKKSFPRNLPLSAT